MADEIKVNPTPIQRNFNDVAMELTQLYYKVSHPGEHTIERIQEVYKHFYAISIFSHNMQYDEINKLVNK